MGPPLAPSAPAATESPPRPGAPPRHRLRCAQVPEVLKKDCLLFYYPTCEGLAQRIAQVSNGNVELAQISWK